MGGGAVGKLNVWAPSARKAVLKIQSRDVPLSPRERGWWQVESDLIAAGQDYRLVLDDHPPIPDPRSAWQPQGTDGPSRFLDHAHFRWTDANWQPRPLTAGLVYELHVGTFSREGTFAGIERHLDHLDRLGVTHVELMPLNCFPGTRGWGYDGVNLFAPHAAYGSPDDLKHLVDTCHAHGLAVILDVVYNHLGPSGNYLDWFGPFFTDHYRTPWGKAVNFDGPNSAEVRRFFCDNALMWLRDYHFDGLRLDAVHAMYDFSARHFLEQLAAEVLELESELGRSLVLIAESDLNDPRIVRPPEVGGYGLDAQWSDDFHHALHGVLTGERTGYYADFGTIGHLAKALRQAFVYDGTWSGERGRPHGRGVGGLAGHRFLAYIQNHDQVGNRAQGERIGHLAGIERAKIAAALVLTSPFIPMLFQGEEWGASAPFQYFTHFPDAALGQAVSDGRRREFAAFGWDPEKIPDPQDARTFERSRLNWPEREKEPHRGLLEWYRRLIRLRRAVPALANGRLDQVRTEHDEAAGWLALDRGGAAVACNFARENRTVPLPDGRWELALASVAQPRLGNSGIELPPESVAVLTRTNA
jgi:maltooligosyltrehalose trehalohydrolase